MSEPLRKPPGALARVITGLSSGLGVFSALVIAIISILATYNVFQRLTFGQSIQGVVDLSALALVVIAFGGIAQAEVTETHVRLSLFADRVNPKIRKFVLLFAQLIIGVLALVMLEASFERAMASYMINEVQTAQKLLPVWPIRFFIVIGLAVLVAVCAQKFVQILCSDISNDQSTTETEVTRG